MAVLVNPVAWNGNLLPVGPWVKPEDMAFSAVIALYATGDLSEPTPEDFGSDEGYSPEEWEKTLREYKSLYGPKPCPSCVK